MTDCLGEIKGDSEDTRFSQVLHCTRRATERSPPQENVIGGGRGRLTSLPFGAPFMSACGVGAGLVGVLAPLAVC